MMKTAHIFDFRHRHPRRNLPSGVGRKRGESNFVSAFTKAYISSLEPHGVGGKATGTILRLFTPRRGRPRNVRAREKALESLGRFLKFSKFGK